MTWNLSILNLFFLHFTGTSRHNEPLQAVVENKLHDSALCEENNSILERNRALLQYIATLADSNDNKDQFNYEFVESLVKGGAEINTTDQYGQSIFHEVSRSWNVDVAKFLLKHGKWNSGLPTNCSLSQLYPKCMKSCKLTPVLF